MPRLKYDVHEIWLEHGIHTPSRTLILSGDVDEEMKRQVLLAKRLIDNENTIVTVELDTPGGDVYEGLSIYDSLRSFKARVEIIGFGKVWSMGSIIMQAADLNGRLLMPNSTVLIHQGYSEITMDHPETLQRTAREDKRIRGIINRILYERSKLSSNTKMTQTQFINHIIFDQYYDPEQAISAGLADKILIP